MVLAIAGVIIIALLIALMRMFAPQALIVLSTPFLHAGNAATLSLQSLESADEVRRERDALRQEAQALHLENESLRAALRDQGALLPSVGSINAGVLARPPLTPYDVVIVDRGSDDGVRIGALAYGPGGTPVGTVVDAATKSARIALFSSPGTMTEGWIGETRIAVSIKGEGSGAFFAEVARESGVAEGDLVYAAAGGARPIGAIARIDASASSPSSLLRIRPLVNPFSLVWVTIGEPFL